MNVTPKFKIGDKVSFGEHKGVVASDVFRLADQPEYPVYVVRFKEGISTFKDGIPSSITKKIGNAVISEDFLEKEEYTDLKEGDIFNDKYGKSIKIMLNHRDEFILAGYSGNLNKLYSNPPYTKQALLEKINEGSWVKLEEK